MQSLIAPTPLGFDRAEDRRDGLTPWFAQGAGLSNLRQLVILRNLAVVGQVLTTLVVHHGMGITLPVGPMLGTTAALAAFNVFSWRRVQSGGPVTNQALMFQLLADVGALTVLLGLSGGATNPFVGMYALPLTITAACLPWASTWIMALVTIACYSLLVGLFRPLFGAGEEAKYLQLLVSGMWVNYAITAGMIANFVVRIAQGRRQGEQSLASHRERDMCHEHLVRIGTLAAGAAHELAQPLATASLMVDEIHDRCADDPEMRPLVRGLRRQLDSVQDSLSTLLSYGRQTLEGDTGWEDLDKFARGCLDAFRARRPHVQPTLRIQTGGAAPRIRRDMAVRHALLNLLGNAADVSEDAVELDVRWDDQQIVLTVRDRGPGILPDVQQRVGQLFFTTKPEGSGNGLGLCLARAAAERLGGSLRLSNDPAGGACAEITLPLAVMTAGASKHDPG